MDHGTIERELHIDASPEVVFDVVSSPEHVREWWPDEAEYPVVAGGSGRICFGDPADGGFRRLNDGVSPLLIGANAWAEAWAVDDRGLPVYAVGRGYDGERQREMALRFGINLVMYVLTGNYKSDQVHVPALLDRLGRESEGRP